MKKNYKSIITTILLTSVLGYIIRAFFIYCYSIDIVSIQEHPVISFFSVIGLNATRVFIRGILEDYYLPIAMTSTNNPGGNPPVGNPPVGNPPVGNPPVGNPPLGNPPVYRPSRAWAGNSNPVGALPPILNPEPTVPGNANPNGTGNANPNVQGNTNPNVQGDLFVGNGFTFNTVTKTWNIQDPTGVRNRSYNSFTSKQPYASNLARALEHQNRVNNHQMVVGVSPSDRAFWDAFCETYGQGKHNWNSKPKRLALTKLP